MTQSLSLAMSNGDIKVTGVAYSGGKVLPGDLNKHIVVDLTGLQIPARGIPMLTNHENAVEKRIGMVNAENNGNLVTFDGKIFGSNPDAATVIQQLKDGTSWEVSIGADVKEKEFIAENDQRKINGIVHQGPFYHIKKSVLRELSVVAVGADVDASMKIAASFRLFQGGVKMADEAKKDEGKKDEEKKDDVKSSTANLMELPADAPEWAKMLAEKIAKLEEMAGVQKSEEPAAAPEGPVAGQDNATAMSGESISLIAKLQGRLDTLEMRDKERTDRETETGLILTAKEALKGYHISEGTEDSLRLYAKSGKDVLMRFVKDYKSVAQPEPDNDGLDDFAGSNQSDPPEVLEFSSKGPEMLAEARAAHRLYLSKPEWKGKWFSDESRNLKHFLSVTVAASAQKETRQVAGKRRK